MPYYDDLLVDMAENARQQQAPKQQATFDGVEYEAVDDIAAYQMTDIALKVGGAMQAWIETEPSDLDEGESLSDRFDSLMVGIIDEDHDGEISDDEAALLEIAMSKAAEWMISKGLSEDDVSAFFSESADDSEVERMVEFLRGVAPDGEDAEIDELNDFAFDGDSSAGAYDATYKRKIAIRAGKKVIIRKRISGRVKLTAKQKMAVKKMLRKSHSSKANRLRLKSMKRRIKMGI
ncbi:MAG: hypothetical protein D8H97_01865 [Neisseria sp.]|nr:MAG: hypothetical protein D8H97_01865 [Neisseria sp.]DAY16985.1 MAG TPA: hypothetical protein [Caudoviricetes sp.]